MRHPLAIFVQLTTSCNGKCVSCPHSFTYGKKGIHQKGNMTNIVWNTLIKQLIKNNYRNQIGLYLHHEPLLVPSLPEKIKQINTETKAFVVLSTNAELLTEDIQNKLIDATPRQIHINISSAEKEQYEELMGLNYNTVIQNTKAFIQKTKNKLRVEINCPIIQNVDKQKLIDMFPNTKVNIQEANSRGGLLEDISTKKTKTHFNQNNYCVQPTQNFNVLHDGSVIACCMDWNHESKKDFPNILEQDLFITYNSMEYLQQEFKNKNYTRYKMCQYCSKEMGFV